MNEIKIYKIKHSETGLFSQGGRGVSEKYGWSKKGKTWNTLGAVKNHLRQYCHEYKYFPIEVTHWSHRTLTKGWWNDIPETWVVIEMSSITGIKEYPAEPLYPETTGVTN